MKHTDEFGAYKAVVQSWQAGPVIVQTSVRLYIKINALRFVQYFPQGAASTNTSAGNADVRNVLHFASILRCPLCRVRNGSNVSVIYFNFFFALAGLFVRSKYCLMTASSCFTERDFSI